MEQENKNPSKRVASLIGLKPEYEEQYIILHKNTFPGVLERIRKSNIKNYTIYLLDGILFSYYEYFGSDYKNDMEEIADATTKDWWKLTDPMQQPLSTRKNGEWWAEVELLSELFFNNVTQKVQRKAFRLEYLVEKNEELKNYFSSIDLKLFFNSSENICNKFQFYKKDNYIYSYLEFENYNESINNLFKNIISDLRQTNIIGQTDNWKEMREVFHTD